MRVVITVIVLIIFISFSCNQTPVNEMAGQPGAHKFIVEEVMQASSYTYILASENEDHQWLAVPKMENINVGETYFYSGGDEMKNFKSKEFDRTFDSIMFLKGLEPVINIDRADDGITVADVYSGKDSYDGKLVKIRGMVTKFNPDIMGTNWIHIKDGTDFEGENDLTVTSDVTVVQGDVVTFEGRIAVDKDFGSGYFYKVIMEESKIIE
jgi:hypothetical protein